MGKFRLISMTDFVLDQQKNHLSLRDFNIKKYANFLKQPLKLEMFVSCDDDGNVLEIPMNYSRNKNPLIRDEKLQKDYDFKFLKFKKAESKVLFEGFEINKNYIDGKLITKKNQKDFLSLTKTTKYDSMGNYINVEAYIPNNEILVTTFEGELKTIEDMILFNFYVPISF